ncbi:Arc family DNA-binding protein [Agrobacterium pusense]|uniref:Arc family DNA-binding protein n=1 Tax=Agrobacterium pusense TaxID=648995 RepID=UPI002FDE03A0
MAKAGRGSEQVMIRLPDGMRDRIRDSAEKNNRSMNAEIVAVLEEAFPSEPYDFSAELSFMDEIDEIAAKLERLKLGAARQELERLDKHIQKADDLLKKPDAEK